MIITTTFHDIPSKLDVNGRPVRIFVISPSVPTYPSAKFPGMYMSRQQGEWCPECAMATTPHKAWSASGMVCFLSQNSTNILFACGSEIYQVTGPVERFAGQIASQGYVVGG
jgi:carboxymethylenebutenolidase